MTVHYITCHVTTVSYTVMDRGVPGYLHQWFCLEPEQSGQKGRAVVRGRKGGREEGREEGRRKGGRVVRGRKDEGREGGSGEIGRG